jgi:hypothetical protein
MSDRRTNPFRDSPKGSFVRISQLPKIRKISLGEDCAGAIDTEGKVWWWEDNPDRSPQAVVGVEQIPYDGMCVDISCWGRRLGMILDGGRVVIR